MKIVLRINCKDLIMKIVHIVSVLQTPLERKLKITSSRSSIEPPFLPIIIFIYILIFIIIIGEPVFGG